MGGDVEYMNKKPLKIWDSSRTIRKGLAVGSYDELVIRGREKLSIPSQEPIMFVLETDGTQIDDEDYLKCLPMNAVLMVLRQGEFWTPPGMDLLRAAFSSIPRVISDALYTLHLQDEIPSWKIMDNKGRVTVVLHWDHGRELYQRRLRMHAHKHKTPPSPKKTTIYVPARTERTRTIITPSGKKETIFDNIYPPPPKYANHTPRKPKITVINHDEVRPVASSFNPLVMPRPVGTLESSIHIHTTQCSANVHEPAARAASPDDDTIECDFHCCSLHEAGRAIVVQKSVATSPIQDPHLRTSPQPSALSDGKKSGVKQQVRFLDAKEGTTVLPGQSNGSSESDESEDTVMTEKFLLLVDQLSSDHKEHLTVKDVGAILERFSSTIVDVEHLYRKKDIENRYNWTIKATIRGVTVNDMGLVYNGSYFVVTEHPDYKKDNTSGSQDEDEEDNKL